MITTSLANRSNVKKFSSHGAQPEAMKALLSLVLEKKSRSGLTGGDAALTTTSKKERPIRLHRLVCRL